ncbi:transferase [Clostridium botulinum]|uniref:Transferase n=1 Tax=Clostridium botulinum C/D str. DC5 TaxID=1443128 RepID=A0A0A0ICN7_CLOBO|nr:acyltransferase [Clostridium botulinum]KGM97345.1 transferase [Clostridium botulinum C/D str. DC5]KGM98217.1 transferase [Clostridium botulinum D str. CCUG 7971]KOC50426.1 transferase [Clostridium botulinum]KOC53659.1 transferase [Clostridium botulinum]KOC55149.1 transferase [Clostridium botulinum]
MSEISSLLNEIEKIIDNGITDNGVKRILDILKCSLPINNLGEIEIYSDYLPKNKEGAYSKEKRYLHFLWDVIDKSPMSIITNFSIPFRRILAKKLFKSCGKNFIAEENVRFNVPDNIEIGDDVILSTGVFIDSKGGVNIENFVGVAEGVHIFTHSHSEHDHTIRGYKPVILKEYSKIYSNCTILPGVTIGKQAIVGACSVVNKDVEKDSLVVGVPTKKVRDRKNEGRRGKELRHLWLLDGYFQDGNTK